MHNAHRELFEADVWKLTVRKCYLQTDVITLNFPSFKNPADIGI